MGWRGRTFWVGRDLVKRNTESDLHLPAGHPHFFYDQSQQLLAPIEVQIVQARDHAVSEASDALTAPIVLNEILALGRQLGVVKLFGGGDPGRTEWRGFSRIAVSQRHTPA